MKSYSQLTLLIPKIWMMLYPFAKWGIAISWGVHIADVSHYVTTGTHLDQEAFERGTSIYYADRVIPMLPERTVKRYLFSESREDRLSFSAILTISEKGELLDYDFKNQ